MRSSPADLPLNSADTYDAMTWSAKANGIDQDADRSCRKFAGSCVAASICLDDYLKVPCQAWVHWTIPAGIAATDKFHTDELSCHSDQQQITWWTPISLSPEQAECDTVAHGILKPSKLSPFTK